MASVKSTTNWFAVWISIAVVVALVVLGGVIIFLNNQATAPGAAPESEIVNAETGAISIGDGAEEVAIWFDFYCPHCQDFEDIYGPGIQKLVDAGDITLQLHPVALSGLNSASGTEFSERSAGALYCVASTTPDATFSFFQQLFAQKPAGPGLTDEELSSLATDAGASSAAECIADGTFRQFAVDQAGELPQDPASGGAGTPTLVVNGDYIQITGNFEADILDRLP